MKSEHMRKTKVYPLEQGKKTNNSNIHVALVYGGMSAEREISLMSYKQIKKALLSLGYNVTPVDMGTNVAECLQHINPDVVFNGIYGTYAEDGCLPGALEISNIKYTHSGVLASAMGFNKETSYKVFSNYGIKCPEHKIILKSDNIVSDPMPRPYVIKPLSQGSSIGVIVVFEEDDFDFKEYQWEYGDRIIVETYIPGQEIHVAVFADKAVGAIEIVPLKSRFYDCKSKYTAGMAKHIMPANLPKHIYDHVLMVAYKAHNVIGCKTTSRVDFRCNPDEGIDGCYVLEINTHPGMTNLSLIPEICAYHGITFEEIINKLVQDAL